MEEEFYYKGKNFTINLDNKEKLVLIEVHGIHTLEDAEDFKLATIKLFKDVAETKRKKLLLDFSNLNKVEHEARRIYTSLSKEFLEEPHIAIFGMNIVIGVLLGFVLSASGRKGIKFFKGREEAVKWLKKQK